MLGQRHIEERYRQKFNSDLCGAALSVGINAAILFLCSFNGLKYIYPPPEERAMVVDCIQMEAPDIPFEKSGPEPAAEAEPSDKLEYVQKSEAPYSGTKNNAAQESTAGSDGDVEVPAPPKEEVIDKRSLFQAARNSDKDTQAMQTAKEPDNAFKAGHASGNTALGRLDGSPSARVKGRSTVGVPVTPAYTTENEGTVVVEIWVNQMGEVERAIAGSDGTTVTDGSLWNAARQAALRTRFNVDPEAPGLQKGTITYIYKLQ